MDISYILGVVVGLVFVLISIFLSGSVGNFLDPASVMIVIGGTIAAVIASYPLPMIMHQLKHLGIILKGNKFNPKPIIETLTEFAQEARKNGLLALEPKANELQDPFFRRAVMLIVDATEPDKVKEMLEGEIDSMAERHDADAAIWEKAAGVCPAFGMIGTLVGLINMLMSMNLDSGSSSSLGTNMAVAMITTFYGCLVANLFLSPVANKLKLRNDEEILYREIIVEGVLGIQAGDNPKTLNEKLVACLSTKDQNKLLDSGGGN